MKIFNWINRHRFPYNPNPAEVSFSEGSSGRRSGSSIHDSKTEKAPLLDEELKASAGGDWELDGILTIGTLAIDPLNNPDEEEEADYYHDQVVAGTKLLNEIFSQKISVGEIEEVEEEPEMEGMRRVTLLDLFMADEVGNGKQSEPVEDDCSVVVRGLDEEMDMEVKNKKKKKSKKIVLYSKLAAAVGGRKGSKPNKTDENVPAIKKLQRFMTKMMKKKIHPDMEAKKVGVMKQNDDVPVSSNDQYYAQVTESVYLLPTQGIMA